MRGTPRSRAAAFAAEPNLGSVARGPVPRDVNCLKQDLQDAQDVPDERALVNANVLFTVARGPVLRELYLSESGCPRCAGCPGV